MIKPPPLDYAGGLGQGYLEGFDANMPQLHTEIGKGLGGMDISVAEKLWNSMLNSPQLAFKGGKPPAWLAEPSPKTRPGGPEFMPPRPKTVIDYANMMNRLLSEGLLTDYMVNYLLRRVRGEKQGAESTTGEGSRYMYFGDTARTNYPPPPRSSL